MDEHANSSNSRTYALLDCVTLCGWPAKQTTPLSVLARNQTKAWAQDVRRDRKWARERQSGQFEKGTQRGHLAKSDAEGRSTTDSRRDQSGDIESRGSEKVRKDEFVVTSQQRSTVRKTVKDKSAFLVACRSSTKNARQR